MQENMVMKKKIKLHASNLFLNQGKIKGNFVILRKHKKSQHLLVKFSICNQGIGA
jgi:hypothetical protein